MAQLIDALAERGRSWPFEWTEWAVQNADILLRRLRGIHPGLPPFCDNRLFDDLDRPASVARQLLNDRLDWLDRVMVDINAREQQRSSILVDREGRRILLGSEPYPSPNDRANRWVIALVEARGSFVSVSELVRRNILRKNDRVRDLRRALPEKINKFIEGCTAKGCRIDMEQVLREVERQRLASLQHESTPIPRSS
jgi:hypothetical protein